MHSEANGELLDALIVCGLAFSAGVDIARLVSGPNIEPWAVRIGDRLCVMRPWSYPNGDVNWTTLRQEIARHVEQRIYLRLLQMDERRRPTYNLLQAGDKSR